MNEEGFPIIDRGNSVSNFIHVYETEDGFLEATVLGQWTNKCPNEHILLMEMIGVLADVFVQHINDHEVHREQ